tara:strand:+ start:680 stop:946 length:267 start_codon:yes stop_codon:yes gene_type:complete
VLIEEELPSRHAEGHWFESSIAHFKGGDLIMRLISSFLIVVSILAFCLGIGNYFEGGIASIQTSTNAVLIAIWFTLIAIAFEVKNKDN